MYLVSLLFYDHLGITDAKAELQKKKNRSFKINTLCMRYESGEIRSICFDKAAPLLPFAKHFCVLTQRHNSSLFLTICSSTIKKAKLNNPNLSINHLEAEVWLPAFRQCQNLLDEMYEMSITLSDVDKYFGRFGGSDLTVQLKTLFRGINECTAGTRNDDWIQRSVKKIEDYQQLCGYRMAANYFLKLRDLLELSRGDFGDVEMISKEVMHALSCFSGFFSSWLLIQH